MKLTRKESKCRSKLICTYHLKKQAQQKLDDYVKRSGATYSEMLNNPRGGYTLAWLKVMLATSELVEACINASTSIWRASDALDAFRYAVEMAQRDNRGVPF